MPKGIRPTQEKVRKALFDILGDIEGLSLLELFAGSGAIGFEAASRGVKELIFGENNRGCFATINSNIEALGLKNCKVYCMEAQSLIKNLYKSEKKFDIIFLDPPYYKTMLPRFRSASTSSAFALSKRSASKGSGSRGMVGESLSKKTLQILGAYDILAPDGFVVIQHFKRDNLPEALNNLTILKRATYGDTTLSFYKKTLR